jgi:hypothetical protein
MRWSMRRRAANRSLIMGAMLDAIGLDPRNLARTAGGAPLAAATRRCLFCDRARACARWIEEHSNDRAKPPDFCPNAEVFTRAKMLAPEALP